MKKNSSNKSLIVRRIVMLISIAIILTAILIAFLGLFLAEEMLKEYFTKQELVLITREYFEAFIISIIFVIPLVGGVSYIILVKIIKPIRNTMKVAIAMIEGDFSIKADENLKGEIGLFSRTVNKLSLELYENVSQLFIEKNRLHQVLYSLDEGMIAVDDKNCITHYNQVFMDMFLLEESLVQGESLDNIYNLKLHLEEVKDAISLNKEVQKTIRFRDLIIRLIIEPIENEKMDVVGAVVLFRDVTEIEKLESMRRDYVANVSHELRSPLTSIRGLIEPLMDSIVTDEKDKMRYYKIIYNESLRLSRLVDDTMELSRLQASETNIVRRKIEIESILEMVYERYNITDKKINLVYDKKDLPCIYSNYDRVEQILVILLDNATKFTDDSGRIEIVTEVKETLVSIKIIDSGCGIDKDDLPFVFNRFYKSDKSRTGKGTGLGLSIAKEILSLMGESITVSSQLGIGSEFEFTLQRYIEN